VKPKPPPDPIARLAWICFALGVAIVFYWTIWGFPRALPKPLAPDPSAFAVHPVAPPAPSIVAAITERPLFLPGRQAQNSAPYGAALAPNEADFLNEARLVGIASEPDGGIAIVSLGGKQRRVRQGEEIDGWTLDRIQSNAAYFTKGGELHGLRLVYRPGQAPPTQAFGAPRPYIPPGPKNSGGGPPQYPHMPLGMEAPADMQAFPQTAPPQSAEAAQNAYRETLIRQGAAPP
jgi:hypothetical protein